MGAVESSSLENIDSLSSALERIEQKLTSIESTHLHHEAKLCHDDLVIICSKKISCRPNVKLLLGPILGLVTSTSVNVMVEIDCASEVSLYIFKMDKLTQEGVFHRMQYVSAQPFEPIVATIGGLSPGDRYAVYVGGVQASDTLHHYGTFETLPSDPRAHRIMFTHDSQADRIIPGEANLWTQVESHVSRRSLERHDYDYTSGDSRKGNHNMPDRDDGENNKGVHMVTHIGNFISIDRFLRAAAIQLLHEICNDDVPVDAWKDKIQKVEMKLRDHYRTTLTDNPAVRRSLRLCGHIFLCGPAEAGGSGLHDIFATFFASTISSQGPPVEDEALAAKILEDSKIKSASKSNDAGDSKDQDDEASNMKEDEGDEKIEEEIVWNSVGEAAKQDRENKYSYTMKLTRDQQEAAKLIYGCLLRVARRVQTAYLRQLWDVNYPAFKAYDALENERHFMMLYALKQVQGKRHLRMRMEKSFKLLRERNEDAKDHAALIRFKEDLKKLDDEVTELENRMALVYEEGSISSEKNSEAMLRPIVNVFLGGETLMLVADSLWCEVLLPSGFPSLAPVGAGEMELPLVELEISSEFYDDLEKSLAEDNSADFKPSTRDVVGSANESDYEITATGSLKSMGADQQLSDDIVDVRNTPKRISNILLISFHNFISAGVDTYDAGPSFFNGHLMAAALGARVSQSGQLCTPDRQKLLNIISTWKEALSDRNCLITCALNADRQVSPHNSNGRGSRSFSTGWTMSYAEGLRYGHIQSSNTTHEMGGKAEARLQYLLVGGMNNRSVTTLDNCSVGSAIYQDALLVAALADDNVDRCDAAQHRVNYIDEEWILHGHLASVRSISKPDESGFVIVTSGIYLNAPPLTSPTSQSRVNEKLTSLLNEPPAVQFHATYVSPHRVTSTLPKTICDIGNNMNRNMICNNNLQLILGPIIGAVTSTSCHILCEYFVGTGNDQHQNQAQAVIRLIDQVSGVEFLCRKDIRSRQPCVFTFTDLIENRNYTVHALLPTLHGDISHVNMAELTLSSETLISGNQKMLSSRVGSLTTPASVPRHILAKEWHEQTVSRMRGRSLKPVVNQIEALAITDVANTLVSSLLVACAKAAAAGTFDELKTSTQYEGGEVYLPVVTDSKEVDDKTVSSHGNADTNNEQRDVENEGGVVSSRPQSGKSRPNSGKSRPSSGKSRRNSTKSRPNSGKRLRPQSGNNRSKRSSLAIAGFTAEMTQQLLFEQQNVRQIEQLSHQYLQQHLSGKRIMILGANQPSWRKHIVEGVYNGDTDAADQEELGLLDEPTLEVETKVETVVNTIEMTIEVEGEGTKQDDGKGEDVVKHDKKGDIAKSGVASDLATLVNGDALCRTIGSLTQESWSGVDLIIHCGGSVDISLTLQDAMSSLARAEVLRDQSGQRKEKEYNRLIQLAEEQLRDAYRWHWSSSTSSVNMGHGSHLFCCSSALVDLLSASHYSSVGNLINDSSKFCVDQAIRILEKLEHEYQRVLWKSSMSPNIDSLTANNCVHFLDSGSVCLFQLCPRLSVGLDSTMSSDSMSLMDNQLHLLKQILLEGDLRNVNVPNLRGNVNGLPNQLPLTSLVILSPIQMIYPTHVDSNSTSSFSRNNLKYANGTVQAILDVITDWIVLSSSPSIEKEVIFICPSTSATGQTIKIKGFVAESMNAQLNNNADPLAPFEEAMPHVEFTQLCCGPSVSVSSPSSTARSAPPIPPHTPRVDTNTNSDHATNPVIFADVDETIGDVQADTIAHDKNAPVHMSDEIQTNEVDRSEEMLSENTFENAQHGNEVNGHSEDDVNEQKEDDTLEEPGQLDPPDLSAEHYPVSEDVIQNEDEDEDAVDEFDYEKEYGEGYGFGYDYTPPVASYDFPLYTNKGRVFISTVERTIIEPHCGMLYVGGNVAERRKTEAAVEENEKLPEDERKYVDSLPYSSATSLLRLEEMFDLEVYLSNSDQYRVPIVVQDAWASLKTLLLEDSAVILHTHDYPNQVAKVRQQSQQEYSFEVKTIYKAVFEVCKRCQGLFNKCYELHQRDTFGGGVMYNSLKNNMINYQHYREVIKCTSGISNMLVNIFNWILRELPSNMRGMFPTPSPFLMKQFWIFFAENYCVEYYAHIGQDRDTTVSLNEVALLTLHTDPTLFTKLCTEGLRCIALFVQVSDEYGLVDYDKW